MKQYREIFSDLDYYFASKVLELNGEDEANDDLFLISMLLSHCVSSERHICLDIADKKQLKLHVEDIIKQNAGVQNSNIIVREFSEDLPGKLSACRVVGKPGEYQPLILDANHLYLHRFWVREQVIAKKIRQLSALKEENVDIELLKQGLNKLFPITPLPENKIDWQRIAAFCAVINKFCVITGGPGTGKTTVVAAVLALLQEQSMNNNGRPLTVKLCTPTGKASARLTEAVAMEKVRLKCSKEIKSFIPEKSTTIHKLLGGRYLSPNFKYNSKRKLEADVVVVDEASMVPMMIMAKLLDAVAENTKIILLGDKDQLASVEAGAIFGDVCDAAGGSSKAQNLFSEEFIKLYLKTENNEIRIEKTPDYNPVIDSVVELVESHRFASDRSIGKLKNLINEGDSDSALSILENPQETELNYKQINSKSEEIYYNLKDTITNLKVTNTAVNYLAYINASDINEAFRIFDSFRILCAYKVGVYGTKEVNKHIIRIVKNHYGIPRDKKYFKGMPILIKKNYSPLGLYNGDIGLCWSMPDNPERVLVYFSDVNNPGKFRHFTPAQLPDHETVFAMTIHKSQGAGFENVLIILSDDNDSPLLTRELLYTGITRAEKKVMIWCSEKAFIKAVKTKTIRYSGLSRMLKL